MIIQGDKDAIKLLVATLVALKLEYKEKSGKEYGAAPASNNDKEKKVVAPVAVKAVAVKAVKAAPAPVSMYVRT